MHNKFTQEKKLYDLTPAISPDLKVWPGDTPMSYEVLFDQKNGDMVTLSTIHSTVHLGAHADAPSHYGITGESMGERDLRFYLGRCQVVRVNIARGGLIRQEDLNHVDIQAERVLFFTGTFPDRFNWNDDFAALSPELIDYLNQKGVILIGIDTPSVDLMKSKELLAHKKLLANDMAVLEGLMLSKVPEGFYELIALPLKLMGLDGSPVRAILREL